MPTFRIAWTIKLKCACISTFFLLPFRPSFRPPKSLMFAAFQKQIGDHSKKWEYKEDLHGPCVCCSRTPTTHICFFLLSEQCNMQKVANVASFAPFCGLVDSCGAHYPSLSVRFSTTRSNFRSFLSLTRVSVFHLCVEFVSMCVNACAPFAF